MNRLQHVPKSAWEPLRDAAGRSIRDVVAEALSKTRGKGGRLNTKFWVGLFEKFKLGDCVVEALGPPEDCSTPVPDGLLAALEKLHSDNPSMRSAKHLEKFLTHCEGLEANAVQGLLGAICESATLCGSLARRAQVAVLTFWAKHQLKASIRSGGS